MAQPQASASAAASDKNVRLEAFKQAVQDRMTKRLEGFQERKTMNLQLNKKLQEEALTEEQREAVQQAYGRQQDEYFREARKQVMISDFEFVKVIGQGAFGIVRLCKKKDTGEIYAIKQMCKKDMVYKNQVQHIRAEKAALSIAKESWVIGLHYTFQDDDWLYMVMDYLPGGDLMTHLMRKDTFTEDETRFYIAELVEAVDCIHEILHYIHRDIKPDNIVLDSDGHIRLLDFGLCKHNPPQSREPASGDLGMDGQRRRHPTRAQLQSAVGTPDYMGPEVYGKAPYGKECDWWSVGIIMFEMLFGGPPFADERQDPAATKARVLHWRKFFFIPTDPPTSEEARDLLSGLICDPQDRLTAAQIRQHPFFQGLNFKKLREMEAPIKPEVRDALDTQNFDDFHEVESFGIGPAQRHHVAADPTSFAFHDYGYRRDLEDHKPSIVAALNSATHSQSSGL
mmetsp:Transcript_35458/g.75591  ORF Transcript_35458/g.75591 Transcript_35458/m.75591 type:complete len:454 (-) Transcript_35458:25-1386(-)